MKWDDIDDDGVWTVPEDVREKGTIGKVTLPKMARDIIDAQSRLGDNPYVFAGRGNGFYNNLSKPKLRLDAQLKIELAKIQGDDDEKKKAPQPWTVHDVRRTARSLLSRAGVSSEHAERVMGHVIAGVEGTYDRHRYDAEKSAALAKLATLVDTIVNQRENVLPMKKRKRDT
jgi:integrase